MLLQKLVQTSNFHVPQPPHACIARDRLLHYLNKSMGSKLTLIAAPAGFGKTSLLCMWAQSLSTVAWVSLKSSENDVKQFWECILMALEQAIPGIGTAALTFLRSSYTVSFEEMLDELFTSFERKGIYVVLVLDNYHCIREQSVHDTLSLFLDRLPSHIHLVLATRVEPTLSLSCLRGYGQVVELRADELLCTFEESKAFLTETMQLSISDEVIQEITAYTDGWLVGLRLLALMLIESGASSELRQVLYGPNRDIRDYLFNEVLRQQPASVQTFLLRTSHLKSFSASLCDGVLDRMDSGDMLQYLLRAHVFLSPIKGQPGWYRYHPLFADMLSACLEQEHGYLLPQLHQRASIYYERHGRIEEAIDHALLAQEWRQSATLIEEHVALFTLSHFGLTTVKCWLQKLPVTILSVRPRLCLLYAFIQFLSNAEPLVGIWLTVAENSIKTSLSALAENEYRDSVNQRKELEGLAGIATLYRAYGMLQENGDAALALCQKARQLLAEDDLSYLACVLVVESLVHYYAGDAISASQSVFEAQLLAQAAGGLPLLHLCVSLYALYLIQRSHLAEAWRALQQALDIVSGSAEPAMMSGYVFLLRAAILYEWNQLETAEQSTMQALTLLQQAQVSIGCEMAYLLLAQIQRAQGSVEAAIGTLHQAESIGLRVSGYYYPKGLLIQQRICNWLACGEVQRAVHWSEELLERRETHLSYVQEKEEVGRILTLLALKRIEEANQLLAPLLVRAEQQGRWSNVLELLIIRTRLHMLAQEEEKAFNVLAQALYMAQAEGYQRCFLDEGCLMAALLTRFVDRLVDANEVCPYAHVLLEKFESTSQVQPLAERTLPSLTKTSSVLSERELDVLRLLCNGVSNQQIASDLYVTLSTVKGHVSSIFAKLNVSNRTQAAVRARELSLLPSV